MAIDTIREHFAHPPIEFGPTPFWFLNDDLDEERLRYALEEMREKGIAGVIIHPRTGMEIEYLSETFWDRLRFICEALKRLGMQGWIYDEYNWPSGPVGGKLLRENPEFKQKGLDYHLGSIAQAMEIVERSKSEIAAAFAITGQGIVDRTQELINGDTAALRSGRALVFFIKEFNAPLFAARCAPWTKGERGYLDLLNPKAVDEFMRLTHHEYDLRLKEYYGSPLVGIFTDEPENYASLPYTGAMPAEFERRYGHDFRSSLPSIAGHFPGIPVGDHIRNRTEYFELARDLYAESFFGKIAAWASERGLIFTGHLGEEDDLHRFPVTNMSFYAPLSRMHMPGTDVLCAKHGYDEDHGVMFHPNFNPKALSSTAHHSGAERTLCEIWGGNGWATTPEKLKGVLNWAQACGVNFVNPHAAFMSLRGLRKRDFPASHFPPQPWWRFYRTFSDYIARLSYLNSRGSHVADVLFAFPMKSLWAGFDPKNRRNPFADFLETVSEALLRNQLDFDYLFDEVLESGAVTIEGDCIAVGDERYSLLIVPLAAVVPRKLIDLAEQFAAAGGKVVAFEYEAPAHDEYGETIAERVQALYGDACKPTVVHRRLGKDAKDDTAWLTKTVSEKIRPDLVAEGSIARSLAYLHRRIEGADIYFVANLSEQEDRVELAFRCNGRPQVWDPETGSIKNVLAYKSGLEYTHVSTWMYPNQALYFVITDEPPVDHVDSTNLTLTLVSPEFAEGYTNALEVRVNCNDRRFTRNVEQALPPALLPERWEVDYPLRNILLLDEWAIDILSGDRSSDWKPRDDIRLGLRARLVIAAARAGLAVGRAVQEVLGGKKHGMPKYEPLDAWEDVGDVWCKLLGFDIKQMDPNEEPELLLKIADYVGYETGYDFPIPGCEFAMSTDFRVEHIPDDLALVFEKSEDGPHSINLNGTEVEGEGEKLFVWDASNRAVNIAGYVKQGSNHLRMVWRQPPYPSFFPVGHGIEPVCLVGRFWVDDGAIAEPKYGAPALSWTKIGLPNYIGSLTYKSSFELPITYMAQQLFLKFDRIGVAAEVKINGKQAGVILWRPYAVDITDLVVQGENTIEVTVANTAANLLAEPEPAGLMGRPYVAPYWRHRIRTAP